MADAISNFAYTTVATAPSPATSGTSLVVAAGTGSRFPAVPFSATLWPAGQIPTVANAEIVRVTAVSTDTFTITRAQESTTAQSVAIGYQVAQTITAALWSQTIKGDSIGNVPYNALGNTIPGFGRIQLTGHSWGTGGSIDPPWGAESDYPAILCGLVGCSDPEIHDLMKSGSALSQPEGPNGGGWGGILQFVLPDNSALFREPDWGQVIYPTKPPAPTVHLHGINDPLQNFANWATHGLTAWSHAVTATVSRELASVVIGATDASVTYGGSWTTIPQVTGNSFAGYKRATANAATVTITIPANLGADTPILSVCFIGTADTDTGTYGVTYSGTAANASGAGTVQLAGQGYNSQPVPVIARIPVTPADAGKTIVATVEGISGGTPQVNFDSWWLESNKGIVLFCNIPRYPYGGIWSVNAPQNTTPNQNAATVTALNAFPAINVKLVDLDAVWFARSALVSATISSTSSTSITVTTQGANFPWQAGFRIALSDGTNIEDMLVTGLTVGGVAPTGPIAASTAVVLTVTRAYNGTTAHTFAIGTWVGDSTLMGIDDVHPSGYGHGVIANTVYQALWSTTMTVAAAGQGQTAQLNHKSTRLTRWPHLRTPDNYYVYPPGTDGTPTAPASGNGFATPIYIAQRSIVTEMGCEVTVASSSTGVMRVGLYLPDWSGSIPQNLLVDFGTFVTTSVSVSAGLTGLWQMLDPGWYWMYGVPQGSASPTLATFATIGQSTEGQIATPAQQAHAYTAQSGYGMTSIAGALPSTFTISLDDPSIFTPGGFKLFMRLRTHAYS